MRSSGTSALPPSPWPSSRKPTPGEAGRDDASGHHRGRERYRQAEAGAHRPPARERGDGPDPALEAARPPDLRLGPALVGGVRDGGRAGRPRRRLGNGGDLVLPFSAGIAVLLAIVVLSYRQTVNAYETSGGAYVVSRDNLGRLPSLVAAAALLVDYVLTVAVSVTAGVLALTSAAPSLESHKVELSLLCVVVLTLVNLRGVRESGLLFALPTYAFVAVMYVLVGTGVGKCLAGSCPVATTPDPLATGVGTVGVLVVLRAFASGAAALTGVEAISNGVSAFRPPKSQNAARTLVAMGVIAITLFLGVSWLAVETGARPSESVCSSPRSRARRFPRRLPGRSSTTSSRG